MAFCIGKKYRDKVTGFTGLATRRIECMYEATELYLESESLCYGEPAGEWFPETRLVEVEDAAPSDDVLESADPRAAEAPAAAA